MGLFGGTVFLDCGSCCPASFAKAPVSITAWLISLMYPHCLTRCISCFTAQMPHESVEMGVVVAQPADACKPLENDVRGKAVLVRRGGCPFVQKAEQVRGLCLVLSCMRMGCAECC
jgi:hypothetical protein